MKTAASVCAALLAAITLAHVVAIRADSVDFKRTFKDKEVVQYKLVFGDPSASDYLTAQVQATVTALLPDGATVEYKALSIHAGDNSNSPTIPDLTTKVDGYGLPIGVNFTDGLIFLAATSPGITPNATSEIGKDIPVHWQNQAKDITLEGKGKITAQNTNTITVDWLLTLTPNGQSPGQLKITSVYSTNDFSLNSSKGTITVDGKDSPFTVTRSKTT